MLDNPRYPESTRKKAEKDFELRVAIAQQPLRSWTPHLSDRVAAAADLIEASSEDRARVPAEYERADRRLSDLEKYLNEMVRDYDQAVEREIDLRRGK